MSKYVVEREYLLPVYQRVIVEGRNPAQACRAALTVNDWEEPKTRFDEEGRSECYVVAIARGDNVDDLGDRQRREVGSPVVPEQHQGGLHIADVVADEISVALKELIEDEADIAEIDRLRRWRTLLRQVS